MNYPLCDKYGFDEIGRRRRIKLLGLSRSDHRLVGQLHARVITPFGARIIDDFYDYLVSMPETAWFLDGGRKVPQLKVTHADYLDTLGIGFDSPDYFESRLRAGIAHARIGLPLSLYLAAYRLLEDLILDRFSPELFRIPEEGMALVRLLGRVIKLDISLAIEVYHQSQIQDWIRSVHSLADEKEELSQQIRTDALTEVSSRRHLEDVLAREIRQARAKTRPLSVAIADLDHFKQINDEYGHLIGDQVLREVGHRLAAVVRERDTVGRFGGEEFLFILPASDLEMAAQVGERIRRQLGNDPLVLEGRTIPLTISVGVATLNENDDAESLLERADEALYAAKQGGRNRVVSL